MHLSEQKEFFVWQRRCQRDAAQRTMTFWLLERNKLNRSSIYQIHTIFHCTPQASFQLRRLKVPWTADEEDILREGVQIFSSDTTMNKRIPWKKILKFGCNVCLNDRTTVDLKDKWRNMCKASSKSN